MTVDPQLIMLVCCLSVCASTNPNPYSLLASTKCCAGSSGLYGFSCMFCAMLCLICLNSVSSSVDHVPSQWVFSCVISLRCLVCVVSVGYQLCSTFTMPKKDCTCVFVFGGSMLRMVSILAWSAFIVCFFL